MVQFGKITTPETMEIVSIVEELRNTSSTNAKKIILEKNICNEGLKTALWLTYNPFRKYKITEKVLDEGLKDARSVDSLNILLHLLSTSNINDRLRQDVNNFLEQTDEELREFYKCIILKDLKIGVNITTINKVWDGLIPTGETGVEIKPMLASKFDFNRPPKGDFVVTEKLDGVRCIAHYEEGDGVQLYTRQGKRILGCIEIENAIRESMIEMEVNKAMLDGELIATDCSYEDVYKETIKRVKNKNEIKEGIKYVVFDILTLDYRYDIPNNKPYSERRNDLLALRRYSLEKDCIEILPMLYVGNDISELINLLDIYKGKGAEGLMVNLLDAPYEFKRSKNILKVKVMQTADLKIVGFQEGQSKNKGKLGALLVDYKGNTVGVGSGFSDFDREYIWNNQDQYLGKIAEIQYFEVTKDKTGTESLRFPVWKHLRTDKTEPSLH